MFFKSLPPSWYPLLLLVFIPFGLSIRTSFRLDYFATFPEEIAAAMERGWWRRIAQP
jgi:hypothetical protein